MIKNLFLLGFLVPVLYACNHNKKKDIAPVAVSEEDKKPYLDRENFRTIADFRASEPKYIDLIHMDLDLQFSLDSERVEGKASIEMKAHAYSQDSVQLDARGFTFQSVLWKSNNQFSPARYFYNDSVLTVYLKEKLLKDQKACLVIDYSVFPGKAFGKLLPAKSDEKGFFFINKKDEWGNKIQQVWTQGETEGARCWFPTIDHPNQKLTHNISITIPKNWVSLSNGDLEFSESVSTILKKDHWSMKQPHAPYLVMVAAGPWAIVEDHWKDKELTYYIDSAYLPYAKDIFGKTPNMISYFSDRLGVPFPWQKYGQVVVQDFISGAMENTTAVTFGSFAQKTNREMVDGNSDYTIAHELFHHWFGDLVTCESWSNLPLNESFATFAEFLWAEHTEGIVGLDREIYQKRSSYFSEVSEKRVVPIRKYYNDPDDLFDSHSYARGGVVLNMLRRRLGDDVFFAGLKNYLTKYAYKTAEIHDLRLAMEEVSGLDLELFFNQWFLKEGHPVLDLKYQTINKKLNVHVKQISNFGLYDLPINLDVIHEGKVISTFPIHIKNEMDSFEFQVPFDSVLVNIDPAKENLITYSWDQKPQEWLELFHASNRLIDQYLFLLQWSDPDTLTYIPNEAELVKIYHEAAASQQPKLIEMVLKTYVSKIDDLSAIETELVTELKSTAEKSNNPENRNWAIQGISVLDEHAWTFVKEIFDRDSSLMVKRTCIDVLYDLDSAKTYPYIALWEQDIELYPAIASLKAKILPTNSLSYFTQNFDDPKLFKFRRTSLNEMVNYVELQNNMQLWEEGMIWLGNKMMITNNEKENDFLLGKHAGIYSLLADALENGRVNQEISADWNMMVGRLQAQIRMMQQYQNLKVYESLFPIILEKFDNLIWLPKKTKQKK